MMRGSPENVWSVADFGMSKEAREWATSEGKKGCRVLAIAWKEVHEATSTLSEEDESNVHVVGMIAFADPLKPSAFTAVANARELGVQVKIITGDAREVAGLGRIFCRNSYQPERGDYRRRIGQTLTG